jgi:hypothetical protein
MDSQDGAHHHPVSARLCPASRLLISCHQIYTINFNIPDYVALLQNVGKTGGDGVSEAPTHKTAVCSCVICFNHNSHISQVTRHQLRHLRRIHACELLANACANRKAAYADAHGTCKCLKEVRKTAEDLQVQEVITAIKLREVDRQIGAIRGALDRLGIPEISLSGDEDSSESESDDQNPAVPGLRSVP